MAWNITGEVESDRIDAEEELCVREDVNQNIINHVYSPLSIIFRSGMSRIKFNVHSPEWSQCMATCPKYNRARVPSFSDQEEFEEVFTWVYNTTINPVTKTLYPDAFTQSLWLPFRYWYST